MFLFPKIYGELFSASQRVDCSPFVINATHELIHGAALEVSLLIFCEPLIRSLVFAGAVDGVADGYGLLW